MAGGTDLVYARQVAEHIGSDHTEVLFTAQEALAAIPDVIKTIESWDTTTVRASVGQYLVSKHIGTRTDCKVVLVGEGPDEVCSSYLFNWYAPSGAAIDACARESVKNIHHYDVKRADRCIARWGLEGRVPLLDPEFIESYWVIPGEERHPRERGLEKWWLREAFAGTGLLPDEVLYRKKEAFSDGVSGTEKSWYEIAQEKAEALLGPDWRKNGVDGLEPAKTAEQQYYRDCFLKVYGKEHMLVNVPYFWMPKWTKGVTDPSARALADYKEEGAS
jgi:asparagine synthase (glutamine-hydrolysing)